MAGGSDLHVVCKSCGSEVSPYITECPYCGNRLRKRAPKIERDASDPRGPAIAPKREAPGLGRLRRGEIPGIRTDGRPVVTIGLVLLSVLFSLVLASGALADLARSTGSGALGELALAPLLPGDRPAALLLAQIAYVHNGHEILVLAGLALFGTLLERRNGHLVAFAVFAGAAVAVALLASVTDLAAVRNLGLGVNLGAHGPVLAMLTAWAVPELRAHRRGRPTDADLIGTGVCAAMLLLVPLASESADPASGVVGFLIGSLAGVVLARRR